jgi:hypothetical protein
MTGKGQFYIDLQRVGVNKMNDDRAMALHSSDILDFSRGSSNAD